MIKAIFLSTVMAALCLPAFAVEERHGILVGEVLKVDHAAKTVVVKVADGTRHTLRLAERGTVHGVKGTVEGSKAAFDGLKEGSEVAVHYTAKGTEETAQEIDHIGKDGLKASEATVTSIDRVGKTLVVKTAKGTEETYKLTDSAAKDAGKETGKAVEKSSKVTVYYTEEAGHKIAHFFKRAI